MVRLGLRIAVISFLFAVLSTIIFGPGKPAEKVVERTPIGSDLVFEPEIDARTVKGYHRVLTSTAWILGPDGNERQIPVKTTRQRDWPAKLEIIVHKLSRKVINRASIDPQLTVTIPDDETLIDQTVTVTLQGRIVYPYVRAFEVGGGNSPTKEEDFKETRELLLGPTKADKSPSKRKGPKHHWTIDISTSFIMIGLLITAIGGVKRLFSRA